MQQRRVALELSARQDGQGREQEKMQLAFLAKTRLVFFIRKAVSCFFRKHGCCFLAETLLPLFTGNVCSARKFLLKYGELIITIA